MAGGGGGGGGVGGGGGGYFKARSHARIHAVPRARLLSGAVRGTN